MVNFNCVIIEGAKIAPNLLFCPQQTYFFLNEWYIDKIINASNGLYIELNCISANVPQSPLFKNVKKSYTIHANKEINKTKIKPLTVISIFLVALLKNAANFGLSIIVSRMW